MVIGIVGKKGAGKDTFAKLVQKHNSKFKVEHFAARLKEVATKIFPVEEHFYHEPKLKECPFTTPIAVDDYLTPLSEMLGLQLQPRGMMATNPRHLLQLVGTEYVRFVKDSYWLDYLENKIKVEQPYEPERFVLVPDVRFENEADRILDFPDGELIKIVRQGQMHVDGHGSEREQEKITCPTLYVNENDLYTADAIAFMFARGFTNVAMDFIHRSLNRHPSILLDRGA